MEIPKSISEKLFKMIDFLHAITKNNGIMPLIGDDDDGRVFKLAERVYEDTKLTITLGSFLFENENWPRIKSEEAIWLLGNNAFKHKMGKAINQGSSFFRNSGVFVMRDKDLFSIFVAGPQDNRYLHSPHKHLDELSIVIAAYGTDFIVDSGTFTYSGDFKWRKKFKGRMAHNTSVIDDSEPVNIQNAFELSGYYTGNVLGHSSDNNFDWIAASYSGYKGVKHIRHFFFIKANYWLIVDLFEDNEKHSSDLYFHFNSGIKVEVDAEKNILAKGKGSQIKIVPIGSSELQIDIFKDVISSSYGNKSDAFVLRFRKNAYSPKVFVTLVFPFKDDSPAEKVAREIDAEFINSTKYRSTRARDFEHTIELKLNFGKYSDFFVLSTLVNGSAKGNYFRQYRSLI